MHVFQFEDHSVIILFKYIRNPFHPLYGGMDKKYVYVTTA